MLNWFLSFLVGWFVGRLILMTYRDRQRRCTQCSTDICEFKTRSTITQPPGRCRD